MINWQRRQNLHLLRGSLAFADTPLRFDKYMVGEISWSTVQSFNLRNPQLLRMIVEIEIRTLPQAVKETVILLTPAGALALVVMLALLIRNHGDMKAKLLLASIALLSTLSLIGVYCMLVFDGRYVISIVPVLIAICCALLLPGDWASAAPRVSPSLQTLGLGLFAASIVFFAVYWPRPFEPWIVILRPVAIRQRRSCAARACRNVGQHRRRPLP